MLTVMCGGDAAAFESVKPTAMAFSRAFTLLGESGAGQLAKMVNQICIAGLVQGLSEAIAFGQKAGLDMNQVLDVIGKGAAQSWQMDNRGKTMVADKFDFGFAVDWMRKDLGLVLDEARRNGARLPVTALVDQFYADMQQMGGNRWDTSSLIKRPEVTAAARGPKHPHPPARAPRQGPRASGTCGAARRRERALGGWACRRCSSSSEMISKARTTFCTPPVTVRVISVARVGLALRHAAHQVHGAALGHHLEGIGEQILGVHHQRLDLAGDQRVGRALGQRRRSQHAPAR